MEMQQIIAFAIISVVAIIGTIGFLAICFRVVVSTNDVHIVQSAKKTTSYGKDQDAGNTYYKWPAWVPVLGVKTISLPVSVFDVDLNDYAAYDKGRVPFVIDIMAFFRIENSNLAAQRVHSFEELVVQLKGILQGACRSILAASEIEEILEGRAKFGEMFTQAVDIQLKEWGVIDVKNIELMDIRDATGSNVIQNIMAKKKSMIEMESRTAVAENMRKANEAEVIAQREVEIRKQEAMQQVGQRSAEKDKQVGIAQQKAQQEIKEEQKLTAQKEMAVLQVNQVRTAEIAREVQVVQADQNKQTLIIHAEAQKAQNIIAAEGVKQQTVVVAEGNLEGAKMHAQGVEVEGRAQGEAEKAVLLAPVEAQITLAKEIGENAGYQKYLLMTKEIEKNQAVGIAQAAALEKANIKVIANSGDVSSGVTSVMDLLTPKGGTQIGGMLEALAQTPAGEAVVKALNGKGAQH